MGAGPEGREPFAPGAHCGLGGGAELLVCAPPGGARLPKTIVVKHWDGAQSCVPHLHDSPELHKTFEPFALGTVILPRGAGRPGGAASHT